MLLIKLRQLKKLKRYTENPFEFRKLNSNLAAAGGLADRFDQVNNYYDQVFGFILCKNFTLKTDTLLKNYVEACQNNPPHLSPNALISLNDGLVLFCDGFTSAENMLGANRVMFYKHHAGEFQYLLHKLISVANNWRTTDAIPTESYIIGDAHKQPIEVIEALSF
ncbi:hypothetical protein D5E80_24615 [Vibrio parahaemolyticus]|nr:hypothetical protein D5E80_24615 [Vibrio parahaemolyticus]